MTSDALTQADREWLSQPEPGWSNLNLTKAIRNNNFVSGDYSGRRISVEYFKNDSDGSLRAKLIFGPEAQGPPGHAHGGSMAAALDEVMGGAAWLSGNMVVAAELISRFKAMMPLGTRCTASGLVDSVSGRRVHVSGILQGVDGRVFSEAEATFVKLSDEQIQKIAEHHAEPMVDWPSFYENPSEALT